MGRRGESGRNASYPCVGSSFKEQNLLTKKKKVSQGTPENNLIREVRPLYSENLETPKEETEDGTKR